MIEDTFLWGLVFEIALGFCGTIAMIIRSDTKQNGRLDAHDQKLENHEKRIEKMEDKIYV